MEPIELLDTPIKLAEGQVFDAGSMVEFFSESLEHFNLGCSLLVELVAPVHISLFVVVVTI